MSRRRAPQRIALTTAVAAGAVLIIFPFYWLVIASTNATSNILSTSPSLLPGDQFAVNLSNLSQQDFLVAVRNSLIVSSLYTLCSGAVCTLAGYGFAKFTFRGRDALFSAVLVLMALPGIITVVPLFKMMVSLGWLNSFAALIVPQLALPFAIFLMRQSLMGVPDEILQSGRVDGAGEVRILVSLVLPIMKPTLAALAIILFMAQWNSFMWPLVVLREPGSYTIPVALATLMSQGTDYGQLMVGTLLAVIPAAAIFAFLQRHFVAGLLSGSVKQ